MNASTNARSTAIRWETRPFEALGTRSLYAMIALREAVFVVEQDCPYLDADGVDLVCNHVLGWDRDTLIATARVVPPGARLDLPSIGRVVTAASHRGRRLGEALMHQALRVAEGRWPGQTVRICAQAHLQRFYGDLGFITVSEPYLEDGIPHVYMERAPGAANIGASA